MSLSLSPRIRWATRFCVHASFFCISKSNPSLPFNSFIYMSHENDLIVLLSSDTPAAGNNHSTAWLPSLLSAGLQMPRSRLQLRTPSSGVGCPSSSPQPLTQTTESVQEPIARSPPCTSTDNSDFDFMGETQGSLNMSLAFLFACSLINMPFSW